MSDRLERLASDSQKRKCYARELAVEQLRQLAPELIAVARVARQSLEAADEALSLGRRYHGAEKHSDEWHDGFETACRLWLKSALEPECDELDAKLTEVLP